LPDEALLSSPRLAVESLEADGSAVVYHADRMTRLRVSRAVLKLLRRFRTPATAAEVIGEYGASNDVRATVARLVANGFLVGESDAGLATDDATRGLFVTTPATLFRVPRAPGNGRRQTVGIFGVPSDQGLRNSHGERRAPAVLRERSFDSEYRQRLEDGSPIGWFDVARRTRILEGVTMSDWGDVRSVAGEPLQRFQERVAAARSEVGAQSELTLALGGDHSTAFPLVASLAPLGDVAVLMFDAHTDFDRLQHGAAPTAINVGRAVAGLSHVKPFIQIGHRGFTLSNKLETGRDTYRVVPADVVRDRDVGGVAELVPAGMPFHVSIDVNVLDPTYAPAVTTLAPNGLRPGDVRAVIEAVARKSPCVGVDVCGFNPECEGARLTAKVVVHLLLACLDAALGSKTSAATSPSPV
jgi:agmatinase